MNWKVIYVKPRNEKKVTEQLQKIGVEAYCPLVTEIRQWSDRKKKVQVPLINSYVFVRLKDKENNIVFQLPGVVRYLFWLGKPALVRDKEIQLMQNWLSDERVSATIEGLQPGDRMKLSDGPFRGENGVVTEITKNRIQLLLPDLEMKITMCRN